MCSCIWLAPPRLAFFLAICGVGHPLTIIIWFNNLVVVVKKKKKKKKKEQEGNVENTSSRRVFSTFLKCSQMTGVFYYSVIHGLGFFICFKI